MYEIPIKEQILIKIRNPKKKRKKGNKNLVKEVRTENFLIPGRELGIQIHEATRYTYYLNAKRHIIINLKNKN